MKQSIKRTKLLITTSMIIAASGLVAACDRNDENAMVTDRRAPLYNPSGFIAGNQPSNTNIDIYSQNPNSGAQMAAPVDNIGSSNNMMHSDSNAYMQAGNNQPQPIAPQFGTYVPEENPGAFPELAEIPANRTEPEYFEEREEVFRYIEEERDDALEQSEQIRTQPSFELIVENEPINNTENDAEIIAQMPPPQMQNNIAQPQIIMPDLTGGEPAISPDFAQRNSSAAPVIVIEEPNMYFPEPDSDMATANNNASSAQPIFPDDNEYYGQGDFDEEEFMKFLEEETQNSMNNNQLVVSEKGDGSGGYMANSDVTVEQDFSNEPITLKKPRSVNYHRIIPESRYARYKNRY